MTEQVTNEPAVTKQDVIDYVITSPQNTNEAVLSTILDDYLAENGSGGSEGEPSLFDTTFPPIEITLVNNSEAQRSAGPGANEITYTLIGYQYTKISGIIENDNDFYDEVEIKIAPGNTQIVSAYGNTIYLSCTYNAVITATGDVEFDEEDEIYVIHGNCTISGVLEDK